MKNKVTAKLFSMDLDFFCSIKANIKLVDASVISALLKVPALFEISEKNWSACACSEAFFFFFCMFVKTGKSHLLTSTGLGKI